MTDSASSLPANSLATEQRDPRSVAIDRLSTREVLTLINDADATVAGLVRAVIPLLETVADRMLARLQQGGSLHYFGAGTSGRMAVLDAAEVPATYGFPAERMVAHLAGGNDAMVAAVEQAEDSASIAQAIVEACISHQDIVFAVAASGTTPYVLGALAAARQRGALTIGLTANPATPLCELAELPIVVPTGAEVITGSTRMKAATAQKMVLQSLSTTLMIKLGRVRSNLMLGMQPSNHKLQRRAVWILEQLTQQGTELIEMLLEQHGYDIAAVLDILQQRDQAVAPSPAHASLPQPPLVLGLDIGGSGVRASFLSAKGEALTAVPPFRFDTNGTDVSLLSDSSVSALKHYVNSQLSRPGQLAWVGVGLAGAEYYPERVARVVATLGELFPAARVVLGSDSVAAYAGAVGVGAGALLAVGTGSIAVASDGDSQWRRVDGLGFIAGDLGSGAWLGREAAGRAIAGLTARGPQVPALQQAFLARFESIQRYVCQLQKAAAPAAVAAAFVPDVVALAVHQDEHARAVCSAAVDHLVETTTQACHGFTHSLVLSGGVLHPGGWMRQQLSQRLAAHGLHTLSPKHDASQGAAMLALRWQEGSLPPALAKRLSEYAPSI